MKDIESPYQVSIGRGSQGQPLRQKWLLGIAMSSIVAVATITAINGSSVPRPIWVVILAGLAILWLFVAYFVLWRDLMLRVYRRLAALDIADERRHVLWLLAFFGVVVFTLAWLSLLILMFGHPR